MQLTKIDGGTFDKDAKACLDRMITVLTSLRNRQLDVPTSACRMHVEYVVKTQAGISDQFYSYNGKDSPTHPTAKANPISPTHPTAKASPIRHTPPTANADQSYSFNAEVPLYGE